MKTEKPWGFKDGLRIVGLDLSLVETGVSCHLDGESVIKPPKDMRGHKRLNYIELAVLEHVRHVDLIVVEGYSFGSQGRATFSIGELGGVIRLAMYRALGDDPYVEVPPTNLKKFATGKGNANKDEVLAAAIRKFDYEGSNNNEADAFILRRMGEAHYHGGIDVTDYQVQAMAGVEWVEGR